MNRNPPTLATATGALAVMLALVANPAMAQSSEFVWVGPADGDWAEPMNWSTGQVPGTPSPFATHVTIDNNPLQDTAIEFAGSGFQLTSLEIDFGDSLTVPGGSPTLGVAEDFFLRNYPERLILFFPR